ncbi:MAG: DUF89 family protein [Deltaproteobacteria bacterium]|nr:DUF89 family protein [Deltaproteobacteria bacterium]MBW2070862.1 DUF89 family protein [Deltaproteobacteria bacterium]
MNMTLECIPCFLRQTMEVVRLAKVDEGDQERILRKVLLRLAEVSFQQSPPRLATIIHAEIRQELGSEDPYREVKKRSNLLALELYEQMRQQVNDSADPFETAVRLAIAGNIIDFGQGYTPERQQVVEGIKQAMVQQLPTAMLASLRSAVARAKRIVYLGDNAGEIVFDRLLIEQMVPEKTVFVVRGGPVLNDATIEDAEAAGLQQLVKVVDNGSNAPGTILEFCSPSFQELFWRADLIIAKGQGNYETLCDVAAPVFFLLKVKCPVIARRLGRQMGEQVIVSTDRADHGSE